MNQVVIADAAVVTPFGNSLDDLWKGLIEKRTAIKRVSRFNTDSFIGPYAALIANLCEIDPTRSMIFNLADMLTCQIKKIPKDTLIFTASTKSGIDTIEKNNKGLRLPSHQLVMSSLPAYISKKYSLKDRGINISSACASSTIAVAKGALLIASGQAESVLICCMDVVSEFVYSGFSALRAMSPKPAQPFDRNRKGLSLGEGAAAILLQSEQRTKKEGRQEMATISGWGVANDATHITAPAKDGCGLKQAVLNALTQAGLTSEAIGAISTHGTGTVYNDAMELIAIRSIFGTKCVPANSIKGSIGHTLGAAGGIEIALGIKMLDEKIVPATVGLTNLEELAEGIISSSHQNFSKEYLLSFNSGFGGINAAVIIKRKNNL